MSTITNVGSVKTRVTTRTFGATPDFYVAPKATTPESTTGGGVAFKAGQYVSFPGAGLTSATGPYINFGSQTIGLGTSGVSIKATFMITQYNTVGIANDNQRLVDFSTGANGVDNLILTKVDGTNNIMFAYRNGSDTQQSVTTTGFPFEHGVVYTVLAVYDPTVGSTGQLSIYCSTGNRVGLTPNATAIPTIKANSSTTYTSTYIGRSSYSTDNSLAAQVYSLGVYKRVLGAQEIITQSLTFVNAPYFTGFVHGSELDINYVPTTSNYTIAFWLYWVSGQYFVATDTLTLGTDGTTFTGYHNANPFTIGGTINQNQWQHVVYAYSSGSMRLFLDGVKVATTSVPTYLPAGRIALGNTLKGSLDDFRIYPASLPDKACTDLYSYETALTSDTPITANNYVCQDIGISFGSNVFPTVTSPGGTSIFSYGTIIFRQTTRLGRNVVTPWFLPTKYAIGTPYTIAEDYSIAFWYYAINNTASPVTYTLVSTPTLAITKAGSNFTVTHTGSVFTLATGVAVDNQWQHVVVTYETDYNVASLFINGVPVVQDIAGGASVYSPSIPFTIATSMTGSLDNIRVYNGRLNTTDVALLYNNERGLPSDPAIPPVGFGYPQFTLNFGTPTVPALTDPYALGQYAVTVSGALTIRSSTRNSRNVDSPFFLNGIKYLSVAYNLASDFTVAMWIYPTASTPCYFIDTTGITFGIVAGNYSLNSTILASALPFPLNTWTHVVLTYLGDFNLSNLYVNGSQVATNVVVSGTPYIPDLISPVTFGGSFTGTIDDIRVYVGTLLADQVSALYAYELQFPPDPTLGGVVYTNPDMEINFGTGVIPTISDVYPVDSAIILDANRKGIPNTAPSDNLPTFNTSNVQCIASSVQYINTGSVVWNVATRGITIVADFVLTGTEQYYEGIFCAQATSGGTILDVGNANNFMLMRSGRTQTFLFRMYDSTGKSTQVYSTALSQYTRYILHAVFDPTVANGTMTLYVNGTQVVSLSGVGVYTDYTYANNCIGCLYPGGYYAANVTFNELAVYNRALTAIEINKIASPVTYTVSDLVGLRIDSVNFEYTNGYAYIPFESSVTDVISNTPVTRGNLDVTYTTGIVGQCALFSGNSTAGSLPQQYYTMPNVLPGYPLSFAFRFNPQLTTFEGSIITITNGAGSSYFSITYNSTRGSLATSTGLDSGLLTIGTWVHVCVTVDSSYTSTMYINGIQVSQQSGSYNMNTTASTIVIGGNESVPPTNGFNGYLDELRMFRRALSSSEIANQYVTTTSLNTWTRNVPFWPRSFVKKEFDPVMGMGNFGYSVSLSGDHTIAAIGAPAASRVFIYSTSNQNILSEPVSVSGSFGNSVSLSYDGSLCVVGAPTYNSGAGYAAVYNTSDGSVLQVLPGSGNQFGFCVSITADGSKVLVGTPGVNGTGGYVKMYSGTSYATVTTFTTSTTPGTYYGYSSCISGDGTTVYLSAPNDGNGLVYRFSATGTLQNTITQTGGGTYGYFGFSLSTSSSGGRVAIGAPTASNNAGAAAVYTSAGALVVILTDTTGSYSQFGFTVALSGDGNTVLVGTPYGNVNDFRSGYACVFNAATGSIIKELLQTNFSLFGVSGSLSYDGSYGLVGGAGPDNMPFTIDGSVLLINTNQRVDTSYYLQGDYTVAGWSRWQAGQVLFSTSTVSLGTDGTRYIGAHNGVQFGIPDTITWPTTIFVTVASGTITKTTGGSAWNGLARTAQSYVYTAYMTASPGDTTSIMAFGLATGTSVATPSIDYGWLLNAGTAIIYENGTSYMGYGTYTTSTVFKVTYDSTKVTYYKDGQIQRVTTRAPGTALYGQANMYTLLGSLNSVDFNYNFSRISSTDWQHVVFTYLGDYNISNIYVNGQLQAYIGTAPPNNYVTGPYTLGLDWQGYIDDIRTYTGVMSPDQVLAMYTYESTLPPEPTLVSYALPNMALNFGTADVQTISSIGSYAVTITGSVFERSSTRLQKTVATPYFTPVTKYLTVTSKSTSPSLTNPGAIVLSTNYTLAYQQTFTVAQTNRNATNLQYTYTGVPSGLIVTSQTDFGVTFTIYKGTTIPNNTFISVTALNPADSSTSVVSFSVTATDGLAVGGDLVTDINGRRIHIFTSATNTLTMLAGGNVDFLVVGGGGGGGAGYAGGGGGAGGIIYRSGYSLSAGTYTITVGSGGRGGFSTSAPTSGGNTSFGSLFTGIGGGAGATDQTQFGGAIVPAIIGGSGGGGGTNAPAGAAGTTAQGYEGGSAAVTSNSSGGGGGASGPGGSKIITISSGAGVYAQFGYTTAISKDGSTIVVGAPWASNGNGYAATYNAGTGVLIQTFTSTAGSGAQFGSSVAISSDGSRVIIGAPLASSGSGYAAVFNGSTGALVATLTGAGSQFGFSVAISADGSTAAVGTPSTGGTTGYVNAYTGATYSTVTAMSYTPSTGAADYFGYCVSVSDNGGIVLAGAPGYNNGAGYAVAFTSSTGVFYREFISTVDMNAYFGFSCAISGEGGTVIVGAPTANNNAGHAATYDVLTGTIQVALTNVPGGTSQFGYSVGIDTSGSIAIVGAPLYDSTPYGEQGGYAALFLATTGGLYRTFASQYAMTGASVSVSSNFVSSVGCAGVDTLPFRVDGAVSIYF